LPERTPRSHLLVSEVEKAVGAVKPSLPLVRLPIEKPQLAVDFLHARSHGVMDLIAHFWERLPQTPPLQRGDLHLVAALDRVDESTIKDITLQTLDIDRLSGVMLYVPKAYRADVLALNQETAEAFVGYIRQLGAGNGGATGSNGSPSTNDGKPDPESPPATESGAATGDRSADNGREKNYNILSIIDLCGSRPTVDLDAARMSPDAPATAAIDFLSGTAEGLGWMVPALLPLVRKRAPVRQLINVVMQLPAQVSAATDPQVRIARTEDLPALNRWRRQYNDERGILFDADLDAAVETQRVFVYEYDKQVVALAKFDLELQNLIEIGGVYTFPEFRKKGFGVRIVGDLACRIRAKGKIPTLQVDQENAPALKLYGGAGWKTKGKLARVWLTG